MIIIVNNIESCKNLSSHNTWLLQLTQCHNTWLLQLEVFRAYFGRNFYEAFTRKDFSD